MKRWSLEFADGQGISGSLWLSVDGTTASFAAQVAVPDVGVVVVRDDEVAPPKRQDVLVIRADGLWAELLCETPGEHWSVGLEAFGRALRRRSGSGRQRPRRAGRGGVRPRVGDTRPRLGEILVGRARYELDARGSFTITS